MVDEGEDFLTSTPLTTVPPVDSALSEADDLSSSSPNELENDDPPEQPEPAALSRGMSHSTLRRPDSLV
ncbi:unnamed protein product [Linum trigynum]|uniref:Uncharacterized protein n=1 Tax=Linum trigynum TaxID=586398 RepID=A0AAV2GLE6_9ROSI